MRCLLSKKEIRSLSVFFLRLPVPQSVAAVVDVVRAVVVRAVVAVVVVVMITMSLFADVAVVRLFVLGAFFAF